MPRPNPTNRDDIRLGQVIRHLREQNGMSQRVLAERLYISQSSIAFYEKGAASLSVSRAKEIAHELDMSLQDLVEIAFGIGSIDFD